MNRRNFIQTVTAAALPWAALEMIPLAAVDTRPSHQPIQPWYSKDGLGLFICWGISSVANIEIGWGLFEDYDKPNHYWPPEKYDALADQFNPQNYNPDLWMEAAVRAGFKYCVFLTRHHDGYALWPSDFGDFSTKQKLHGRDLVRPYVEACRKYGLKVGFYLLTERLALQPARLAASSLSAARPADAPLAPKEIGTSRICRHASPRNTKVL